MATLFNRSFSTPRVAIVTDGFWAYGGAERVVETVMQLYPQADLFSLVDFLPHRQNWLVGKQITTSFLQKLPASRRYFQHLLALWPIAIEQFDLDGYDLVISLQHSVAHGVITSPSQVHVVYTHSPMRYAWDLQHQYLREAKLGSSLLSPVARLMLHRLRLWDQAAANRAGAFSANSAFVAKRIKKYYNRDSVVIYPPVFLNRFTFHEAKCDYYLFLGRLVAYKRVDLLIDAFAAMPDKKLIIAGDGPLLKAFRARASKNVNVVGPVDAAEADRLMGSARAFLFAAIEDFGIAPVEAQAAGTPVIGLGIGGLCETVRDLSEANPTGMFFDEQTVDSVCDAIFNFERVRHEINATDCLDNAQRFSSQNFKQSFTNFVQSQVSGNRVEDSSCQ